MSPSSDAPQSAARRPPPSSLRIGAAAFVLYGGWAAWANHDHGWPATAKAALTQGLLSFCVTVFMTIFMHETYRRLAGWPGRPVLTATGPLSFVLSLMAIAHVSVGTPNVIKTIAPSAVIGFIYCVIYTWTLTRIQSPARIR